MIDINKLILEAMKSRDRVKSQTFKLVKAKILEFKTQEHAPAYTEEAEIKLLQKMCKELKNDIESYKGREDLQKEAHDQLVVIESLLPPTPTKEDVINFLNSHYPGKINKKDMGKVIKEIKSVLLGVDGKLASDCVKEKLEEA